MVRAGAVATAAGGAFVMGFAVAPEGAGTDGVYDGGMGGFVEAVAREVDGMAAAGGGEERRCFCTQSGTKKSESGMDSGGGARLASPAAWASASWDSKKAVTNAEAIAADHRGRSGRRAPPANLIDTSFTLLASPVLSFPRAPPRPSASEPGRFPGSPRRSGSAGLAQKLVQFTMQ